MQRILFLGDAQTEREQLLGKWLQSDMHLALAATLAECVRTNQWDNLVFDHEKCYEVANVALAKALITIDQYASIAMRKSLSADLKQNPSNIRAYSLRDGILSPHLTKALPTIDNLHAFLTYVEANVTADQQFCFLAYSQNPPNEFMSRLRQRNLGFLPLFDILSKEAIKTVYVVPSFAIVKAYEAYRLLQNNAKKESADEHEGSIDVVVAEGTVTAKDVIAYRANNLHLLCLSSPLDRKTKTYNFDDAGEYGYFMGSWYAWSSVNLHVNIPLDSFVVKHVFAFYEERTNWPVDQPIPERHKDYHLEGLRFLLARMVKLEFAHYSQNKNEFGHSFYELVNGPSGSLAQEDYLKCYSHPLMKSCLDALLIKIIEQRDTLSQSLSFNPAVLLKNALKHYRYNQDHHRLLNPKDGHLNFTAQVCHLLADDSPLDKASRDWLAMQLRDLSEDLRFDQEADQSNPPLRVRLLQELNNSKNQFTSVSSFRK